MKDRLFAVSERLHGVGQAHARACAVDEKLRQRLPRHGRRAKEHAAEAIEAEPSAPAMVKREACRVVGRDHEADESKQAEAVVQNRRVVHPAAEVVKQLTYICRRQKVNLNKIDRAIGNQRTRLLCCEEMIFPNDSGYKRFYSPLFSARLCTNMALFALSKFDTPERLTVGIYDPDAQCTDLVSFVLKYTGNACIITDNEDVFYDELNTIAEETGACAVVTHHREQLSNCDLVIAPFEIEENLPVRNDAVILTNGRPKENIKGFVYFRYCFKMPNGFALLRPEGLSEEYFCSALYTLGSQYELGSIVPDLCRNDTEAQTVKSLCSYLARFA